MKIYVLQECIDYEIENIRVTTDKQSVLDLLKTKDDYTNIYIEIWENDKIIYCFEGNYEGENLIDLILNV